MKVIPLNSYSEKPSQDNFCSQTSTTSKRPSIEKELFFESIFNIVPSAMFLLNSKGKIIDVNKHASVEYNLKSIKLKDKKLGDILNCRFADGNDTCQLGVHCKLCHLNDIVVKIINDKIQFNKEEIIVSLANSNELKTILLSSGRVLHEGEEKYLIVLDDITLSNKLEENLFYTQERALESEKLKLAFLQNINHEIRTPLNGILGFTDILEDQWVDLSKEKKEEYFEIIRKSGFRLLATIDNILEFSKLETGVEELKFQSFVLDEMLTSLITDIKSLYKSSQLNFSYEIDQDIKDVLITTDKDKLDRILKGLIDNAIKYNSKENVKLVVKKNVNNYYFAIQDDGIGIPEKYLNSIFNPFTRTEYAIKNVIQGNGLGLSITKALVNCLGGDLKVISKEGLGSTFYFEIPII